MDERLQQPFQVPRPAADGGVDADPVIGAMVARVARGMLLNPPDGWGELRLESAEIFGGATLLLDALMPDGEWRRYANHCDDLFDGSKELRQAAYVPGRGTWFVLRVFIDAARAVTYELDYDSEPTGYLAFSPHAYVWDLRSFPRDEEHCPQWLKDAVATSARLEERNVADRARRAARAARRKAEKAAQQSAGSASAQELSAAEEP